MKNSSTQILYTIVINTKYMTKMATIINQITGKSTYSNPSMSANDNSFFIYFKLHHTFLEKGSS